MWSKGEGNIHAWHVINIEQEEVICLLKLLGTVPGTSPVPGQVLVLDPGLPGIDRLLLSDLPSCQQLRKKVLFYYQKLSSVPVTQLRRKSLQVLRFSHHLVRLFVKKLKGLHKKNIFSIILLTQIPDLRNG